MNFKNVAIGSFGYFLSDHIVTSDTIEQRLAPIYERLKLPSGRLELMTGIKERRMWDPGILPSEIATKAASNLFQKENVRKEEIDLLIHGSVCRDFLEPSTASVIHHNLKLNSNCMFFDLSNACLGVINSIIVASHMIENGNIKNALIVSGENGGPLLEETIKFLNTDSNITRSSIKKYIANLTIGSAAVAIHLTHKDLINKPAPLILGGAVYCDSSANVLCCGDGNTQSLTMETNSEELMKKGVELAVKNWQQTKLNLNITEDDVTWALGHQVGMAHEKLTMDALNLRDKRTHITYDTLGNTGSAALPITLMKLMEQNHHPKPGDTVALLGIGSGLSSIMVGLKWQ